MNELALLCVEPFVESERVPELKSKLLIDGSFVWMRLFYWCVAVPSRGAFILVGFELNLYGAFGLCVCWECPSENGTSLETSMGDPSALAQKCLVIRENEFPVYTVRKLEACCG